MTYRDKLLLIAARLFMPDDWQLDDTPPVVEARDDGDGRGRVVFGLRARRVAVPPPIDRQHLRRDANRNR